MWSKKFGIACLVLLVACSSLWAFPGRVTASQETSSGVTTTVTETTVEEVQENSGFGLLQENESTESLTSSTVSTAPTAVDLVVSKIDEGKRISSREASIISSELTALQDDLAALEDISAEKDALIEALEKQVGEAGTKAWVMLDAIVGLDSYGLPEYGVGLTFGARLGNSLMTQIGVDYTFMDMNGMKPWALNNMSIRAGIGWMF